MLALLSISLSGLEQNRSRAVSPLWWVKRALLTDERHNSSEIKNVSSLTKISCLGKKLNDSVVQVLRIAMRHIRWSDQILI